MYCSVNVRSLGHFPFLRHNTLINLWYLFNTAELFKLNTFLPGGLWCSDIGSIVGFGKRRRRLWAARSVRFMLAHF
jgi:hypothetical protein